MGSEPIAMRVAVLTSETLHHTYFVQELGKRFGPLEVFEENRPISADFETAHPYEEERNQIEREAWFGGETKTLSDVAKVHTFENVNDPECIQAIREFNPDAILAFGTGKLSEELIDIQPERIINLHGANPEDYSGLDTHLWAIYHRDFDGLITTLHRIESNTDRGGTVLSAHIPVTGGMKLAELRKVNTEVCLQLSINGLSMLNNFGQFISRPQNRIGRRYSFMPSVLKEVCVNRFEDYTKFL